MRGDNDEDNGETLQRLQSSFGTSSSSVHTKQHTFPLNQLDIPQLDTPQFRGQIRHLSPNLGVENYGKRAAVPPSHPQIPPISPYSQIPVNRSVNQHNFGNSSGPSHARSLSQPALFAVDSLPPLVPSPYRDSSMNSISDQVSTDVSMEETDCGSYFMFPPSSFTRGSVSRVGESLPPRKAHRRSNSDIPFGFSTILESSPPFIPLRSPSAYNRSGTAGDNLIKKEWSWERVGESSAEGMEERKSEGEILDDMFSAYMNLDNIDAFNSSATNEKLGNENRDDLDSRASGTKTNGGDSSDNEATSSSVNESGNNVSESREGIKRNAGGDISSTPRHCRSLSMDSLIGNMNFAGESPKMPQLSHTNSLDAGANAFSLEFGDGEFSGVELKKIMENDKLSEIALSDPKRAKRILANRQSAARSKDRKMRYITELEHKVHSLQTEATTLSAHLTMLQRNSSGLTSQNHELKFRLQAMEQQAHLRDALNEALTSEVQRLKRAMGDPSKLQQLSINSQMFQLHQQQSTQMNTNGLQQQPQQVNNNNTTKNETKQ